jgi:hypothetical protein
MSVDQAIKVFATHGVPNADQLNPQQLKDARKRLIQQHHPDLGGKADAGAMINSAYDTLKDGGGGDAQDDPPSRRTPEEPAGPWAHAGYSGGMSDSGHIYRQDYTDVNFIKKRMWELSNHSKEEWTIMGFDGAYLRASVTVYGSREIFDEMAEAVRIWQTKGGNTYPCRAVLVSKRRSHQYFLIWADGRSYAKNPIEIESDSFNDNPSNDRTFEARLRKLIDQMEENGGPLPDQPSFDVRGYQKYSDNLDVGDRVLHPRFGNGVVIKVNVRPGYTRVYFDGKNRSVRTDALKKLKYGWH